MATLTISLRESAILPILGKKSVTEPIAHIDLPDNVSEAIRDGLAAFRLPGQAGGVVLDLTAPVSLPFVGHGDVELVVSLA